MAHDQVGPDFGASLHRFVDGHGMPDAVLEGAAAIVSLPGGAALDAILYPPHAALVTRRSLGDEGTLETVLLDQVVGDLAELG